MSIVPIATVDWTEKEARDGFQAFFERMPDDQKEYANGAFAALGVVANEDSLKAYALGVATVMAAVVGHAPGCTPQKEEEPEHD